MKKERRLTIDKAVAWLQSIICSEEFEDNELAQSLLPLSRSTVHYWMKRCGAKYTRYKNSYYTDGHEKPDTIADRNNRYLPAQLDLLNYKRVWVWKREDSVSPHAVKFTRLVQLHSISSKGSTAFTKWCI
jgi:hypothetical protein